MSGWRDLLDLPPVGSTAAAGIDRLHASIILTTLAGALIVGCVTLVFTWRFRRRDGDPFTTPQVVARPRLEVLLIVVLVVLFSAWWWIGFRQFRQLQTPPTDTLDVFVTAKQWMWEFAYDDGRASIAVLVVPAGVPVRLIMSSRDVIHGFSVPDFRLKHDVIPGWTTVTWFQANPGIHPIFCSQYCGLDHSRMQGEVVALTAQDYATWHHGGTPDAVRQALLLVAVVQPQALSPTAPATDDLPTQGMAVAARHGCLACHTTDGQRHIGPSWQGLFNSRVALSDGSVVLADEAYLTKSMMDPAAQVVAGYSASMPSYQGLLEPTETAALVALIKSLQPGSSPRQVLPPLPDARSTPVQLPATPDRP